MKKCYFTDGEHLCCGFLLIITVYDRFLILMNVLDRQTDIPTPHTWFEGRGISVVFGVFFLMNKMYSNLKNITYYSL